MSGDLLLRREVWRGRPWLALPVRVVQDTDDLLALYLASGTPLGFYPPEVAPPEPHPWRAIERWQGHGVLMLQRPGEAHAIWVFWEGPERRFACWYVNLQAPLVRSPGRVDTLDHELDIVVLPDGTWTWKDSELLDERVRQGRYSAEEARAFRSEGERIATLLDAGERWWDDAWSRWEPDPAWEVPSLPPGWQAA